MIGTFRELIQCQRVSRSRFFSFCFFVMEELRRNERADAEAWVVARGFTSGTTSPCHRSTTR